MTDKPFLGWLRGALPGGRWASDDDPPTLLTVSDGERSEIEVNGETVESVDGGRVLLFWPRKKAASES